MKKKFLAMYALAGALVASPVFTSCIDDTESASVTAVRTQKAEAMRIANQIAAANAELKIQKEKLQLEADIANYEANIVNYEKNLLTYQKQLKEAEDALKAYGVKTLSQLTNTYTTALSNAAQSEWQIALYNKELADMEAGLVSAQKAYAEKVDKLNKEIAEAEAKIAAFKKTQEEGMDQEALQAKTKELEDLKNKAEKELKELMAQYGYTTITTASEPDVDGASNLAVIKAINFFKNPNGDNITDDAITATTTNAEGLYVLLESSVATNKETLAGNIETAEKNLAETLKKLGTEADTEKTTWTDDDLITETPTLYADLALANKNMTTVNTLLAKLEKAVTDAKAAYDAEKAKETPDATKLGELEDDVEEALNLLNAYKVDTNEESTTDYDDNAETTEMGYAWAKGELADAESAILTAKDNLVTLEKAVATAKKASEDFEAAIAAFAGEDYDAYKEAVAALDAAYTAYSLADAEYTAFDSAYSEYGVADISNQIADLESQIAEKKKNIENLKLSIEAYDIYNIDNINTSTVDSEELLAAIVAYIEQQIKVEEAWLATYEKQAEEAKAALDAYLAE